MLEIFYFMNPKPMRRWYYSTFCSYFVFGNIRELESQESSGFQSLDGYARRHVIGTSRSAFAKIRGL